MDECIDKFRLLFSNINVVAVFSVNEFILYVICYRASLYQAMTRDESTFQVFQALLVSLWILC